MRSATTIGHSGEQVFTSTSAETTLPAQPVTWALSKAQAGVTHAPPKHRAVSSAHVWQFFAGSGTQLPSTHVSHSPQVTPQQRSDLTHVPFTQVS
ncbi:MAG: hypothetical protein RBU21_23650 [FCB group bacterium]|nr:hypothetical protein [FCB group bacterium]